MTKHRCQHKINTQKSKPDTIEWVQLKISLKFPPALLSQRVKPCYKVCVKKSNAASSGLVNSSTTIRRTLLPTLTKLKRPTLCPFGKQGYTSWTKTLFQFREQKKKRSGINQYRPALTSQLPVWLENSDESVGSTLTSCRIAEVRESVFTTN